MGLDVYLYAEQTIGNSNQEDKKLYNIISSLVSKSSDIEESSIKVKYCVGYWRKCYSINNWFVKNTKWESDESGDGEIELADLYDLQKACIEVLANKEEGKKLLPQDPHESDEGYIYSVTHAIKVLNTILNSNNLDSLRFSHKACW